MDLHCLYGEDRRMVAYHEAAHGVIGAAMGRRVRSIWIAPKWCRGEAHGPLGCAHITIRRGVKVTCDDIAAQRMMINFAGHAAEAIIGHKDDSLFHRGDDFKDAEHAAADFGIEGDWEAAFYDTARREVTARWKYVERVAAGLLKNRRMTAKRFYALVDGCPPLELQVTSGTCRAHAKQHVEAA
jgi:hypothetical protein